MIKSIRSFLFPLLKFLLFWIVLFDVMRLVFMVHNSEKWADVEWTNLFQAFFQSFHLDVATIAILAGLPFLIYLLFYFTQSIWVKRILVGLFILEVICVVLIHAGEIVIYPEWNHKLSTRVFMHLAHLDEVGRTATYGMLFVYLIYASIGLTTSWFLSKLLKLKELPKKVNLKTSIILGFVSILMLPFLVIFARGGLQQIPINIDAAYYSRHAQVNDLSVNATYYFAKSFLLYRRGNLRNDVPEMDAAQANAIAAELYAPTSGDSPKVLTTDRPNVVILVLEGWTANAIKSITGEGDVTPYFDKMTKEGVLFDSIYAAGTTSEIGNASIFGGFPGLPEISVSMQPEKHRKMATLNQDFKKWGYFTSYVFGGDLSYGNIGGFFNDHGFDQVKDEKDFPSGLPKGKLSVYDEDLFKFFHKEINKSKEPFFHCAFTGSTHSPYDHPKKANQTYKGLEQDFMNSMIYADEEIHRFLEKAKKESWYKNTLFILVADHGHPAPSETTSSKNKFFHIPLLFFGEVIKPEYRGTRIHKIGGQSDIAATLLAQLNGDQQRYPYSKDLLHPKSANFIFHTMIRGYGWITPKGNFTYHFDYKDFIDKNFEEKELEKQHDKAKSLFFTMYNYYENL